LPGIKSNCNWKSHQLIKSIFWSYD